MMTGWNIAWAHGVAQVQALGGMLGPVDFVLPHGQHVQPMYVAPWAQEPVNAALPGLLRGLRGEWPCVPFSRESAPDVIAAGWQRRVQTDPAFLLPHGPGSNQLWQLIGQSPAHLLLELEYPAHSAVARLEREIRPDPLHAALEITLRISARADTVWPVALHPTFRLPARPGSLHLRPGRYAEAVTYPLPFEASSQLQPNQSGARLEHMPGQHGALDLTQLPLVNDSEELLQLIDCDGYFALDYLDDAARVTLTWSTAELPDLVLWLSQRGRPYAPWLSRNLALGVEPANGVFELGGVLTPPADHPLAARQGLPLRAGQTVAITYRIAAEALAG
ncbi:hypothetical protein [Amantichitinum ursilacus]|uniref:Aldose 1-epimerase n=1 Tax=Amantichitinum ursilacus TaxID=857265 RepID=A0A0N0XI88_9NEIS|nr:hypothetical protein [Amantichitinum ursilacus]KPC49901.1 hypothetical protein WG78_19185 [Amantichitinum ursilacus]